jgi:hypothetical protein
MQIMIRRLQITEVKTPVAEMKCSLIPDLAEECYSCSSTAFLCSCRNNLEWLARATSWAKFTATASLGVIHRVSVGHEWKPL